MVKITADQFKHRSEHGISPPMRTAITIPILVDGEDIGIAVYVAVGSFAPHIWKAPSGAEILDTVADRIRTALKE